MSITLMIGNTLFEGWKSVDVRVGIEQMAGCFELQCADRWALQGKQLPALPGLACRVRIDGHPVITGWIDEVAPQYSKNDHSLSIRGRDATGDLVDSAAIADGSGWINRSLAQIATSLAAPLGINVSIDAAASGDAAIGFQYSHLQPCETGFETLSRLARMRGLLLVADGLGGLRITRAGTARALTPLVLGDNIKSAEATISHAERFNVYRVIAQARESDSFGGAQAQQVLAECVDPAIRKGRITVLEAFAAADAGDAQKIADWARSTRAGAGERATFKVRGWLDGVRPWQANRLVQVKDPGTRFQGTYLISSVRFTIDEQGELTELTTTHPDAFAPLKIKEQSPTAGSMYQAGDPIPLGTTPQLGGP